VARKGWLIFYTHGVEDPPGRMHTRPDDLAWLLRQCASRGLVLNVREARERLLPRAAA
jgi:hypothetical protein